MDNPIKTPDEIIKTPVRFDSMREVLVDVNDNGLALALSSLPESEYIATCINEHESLTARIAALTEEVDRLKAEAEAYGLVVDKVRRIMPKDDAPRTVIQAFNDIVGTLDVCHHHGAVSALTSLEDE